MTIINMYTPNKRPSEILNLKNITCWSWLGKSVVWLLLWWRSCVEAQLSGVETWTPATWVWTSAISWTPWTSCLHFLSVPSSMKWCCHGVYVQGRLSDGAQCLVESNYGRYYAVISSSLFSSKTLWSVFGTRFLLLRFIWVSCVRWGYLYFCSHCEPLSQLLSRLWRPPSHFFSSCVLLCPLLCGQSPRSSTKTTNA